MSTSTTPKPSSAPWGLLQQSAVPVNLEDIMSEQLAKDLQLKEEAKAGSCIFNSTEPVGSLTAVQDCENDHLIAQMLQLQFDRENECKLENFEYKNNEIYDVPIDSDEQLCARNCGNGNKNVSKCGYKKEGSKIITKHDLEITGHRNGSRINDLHPDIHVGDDTGMNINLSNTVYNGLKTFSRKEHERRNRLNDQSDQATAEFSLDAKTRLLLYKLVNQEILDRVNGIISIGKEAVVLHADGSAGNNFVVPKECAIKVFKTTLNEFKTREKYIEGDFRFKDQISKQNPRKIIHVWAEKEMHNLVRMHKVGIRCPEVVTLKKHVLLMTFLGVDHVPARQLKEAELTTSELETAYEECVAMMKKLFSEACLVHADLSEYNILCHEGHCWFIDVSQAVERNHSRSLEFLFRDCANIFSFFSKRGLQKVLSPAELFTEICGRCVSDVGPSVLDEVQDFERNLDLLTYGCTDKEHPFNYCWENSSSDSR